MVLKLQQVGPRLGVAVSFFKKTLMMLIIAKKTVLIRVIGVRHATWLKRASHSTNS